jgi:formylglycine-generating enzyme required for sulfatase activity
MDHRKRKLCFRRGALLALAILLPAAVRSQPATAAGAEGQRLAAAALKIFEEHCARCHGAAATRKRGGIGYITDLAAVAQGEVKKGKLVDLAAPEKSRVYSVIAVEKTMPDDTDEPLPKAVGDAVLAWIQAGAPPLEERGHARRKFIPNDDLLDAVLKDLLSVQRSNRRRVAGTRYLTLTHLHNNDAEVSPEKLALYRRGLAKLVNSLTRVPAIVRLEPVAGSEESVFRLHLDDLEWPEALWERLVGIYPYGIELDEGLARAIGIFTSSKLPLLRGDWFAFAASQPPLYHEFLELPLEGPDFLKDPSQRADRKLEAYLGVDVLRNIKSARAARAGFFNSGVSSGNRIIERHEIRRYRGGYWVSYDFESSADRPDAKKNIRENPLGPREAFPGSRLAFEHDGGEIIYNLPNGLQAYLIVDARGKRLDFAPPEIVKDEENPRGGIVINGISCMSCHERGMRPDGLDEVRARAQAARATLTAEELEAIEALYVPRDDFTKLLDADEKRFVAAEREATGAAPAGPAAAARGPRGKRQEPVWALFERFARTVRLEAAAAEVGLEVDEFRKRVGRVDELSGLIHDLETTGVAREQFVAVFDRLVVGLGLGTHRKFERAGFPYWGGAREPAQSPGTQRERVVVEARGLAWADVLEAKPDPRVVTDPELRRRIEATGFPWRVREKRSGIEMMLVPAGTYQRGVSVGDSEWEASWGSDETPRHQVTISKPFYLGRYEVLQEEWERVLGQGSNPSKSSRGPRFPVDSVSWEDIAGSGGFLEIVKESGLRLPTEGEWEYACRAAGTARGPRYGQLDAIAWHSGNSGGRTHPAGDRAPNALGLHDMLGNVYEWCSDWYDASEYQRHQGGVSDPPGPSSGSSRVLRGGSWVNYPGRCRASSRRGLAPAVRDDIVGFRVARTP